MSEQQAPVGGTTPAEDASAVVLPAGPLPPVAVPRAHVGALVEFCLNQGVNPGAWRPALVCRVDADGTVGLHVFPDGHQDELMAPLYVQAATHGDDPGRWRYAEGH